MSDHKTAPVVDCPACSADPPQPCEVRAQAEALLATMRNTDTADTAQEGDQ